MKLYHSHSTQNIKKKRIKFGDVLNSKIYFQHSSKVQMALNQYRMLSSDFHIKRVKPKIDTGKKRKKENKDKNNNSELNSSNDSVKKIEKEEIPEELYNILIDYQKKFLKEDEKYHTIKEYNDNVLSFWHYINQSTKKKERDLLLKKYSIKNDKDKVNLYSDEVRKFTNNLFKTNPLLTRNTNNYDIFFFYLCEFNKYYKNEIKLKNVKKKALSFLEKLKDFSEYEEIKKDNYLDPITREIKLKNSKYIKDLGIKMRNEILKNREMRYLYNTKDINESTKMIKETKNTLQSLYRNKNIFEDKKTFHPLFSNNFNTIKSNYNHFKKINNFTKSSSVDVTRTNFYSPKATKMNSTISTDFYLSDKKFNKKNKKVTINKVIIVSNNNSYKKTTMDLKKNNNNDNRSLKRYSSSILNFKMKNNLLWDLKSKINKNISNEKITNNFELNSYRNSNYNSLENDSSSKLTSILKKNKDENISTNNKINLKKNKYFINFEEQSKNKNDKINIKKSLNYDKKIDPLILLFDNIKNKNEIKIEDVNNIKKYFVFKGKNININFKDINSMDIITKAKNITGNLDIEQRAKKVFQPFLSYEQIQKIEDIKNINKKVYGLEIDYMNHIFDYKSKNSKSIQLNI